METFVFTMERSGTPTVGRSPVRVLDFMKLRGDRLAIGSKLRNKKIVNYQAIVPSTWNAGPRDAQGQCGAYEAALQGTPLIDPERPLEVLRTVHSFDPCMACAVHVVQANGRGYGRKALVI